MEHHEGEGNTIPYTRPVVSIVVPVFNESASILPFIERTAPEVESATASITKELAYEIIFVDDGSTDGTLHELMRARERYAAIRIVALSRNFGKDAALSAGLTYATGSAVIPMDVDLQDPPELIPNLIKKWRAGARIVNAVRQKRTGDPFTKRILSTLFYRLYNRLADRPIPYDVGDFRLLDRSVVDVLNALPERVRFMKGLYPWAGFETAEVHYARRARDSGSSHWTFWELWNFALDGITSSTTKPLRIWTYCGVIAAALSFAYAIFITINVWINGREVPGYASLICVVLALGGLNLIALGILGEYIGRIFSEVKGRPLYVVDRTIGFDIPVYPSSQNRDKSGA